MVLFLALLQDPDAQFTTNWVDFVASANLFVEGYFGCPKGTKDVSPSTCRPALGTFDVKRWEDSRRKAAKLFGLEVPKQRRKLLPPKNMHQPADADR